MLQTATVDFQGFPATLGESVRHTRNMGGFGNVFNSMNEDRPFYRVYHMTKQEAATQQIEAAIAAFHAGQFAAAITLAAAAEDMAPARPGGMWETIRNDPARMQPDTKKWIARLNETRNWLKHNQDEPTRNLVAFEVFHPSRYG